MPPVELLPTNLEVAIDIALRENPAEGLGIELFGAFRRTVDVFQAVVCIQRQLRQVLGQGLVDFQGRRLNRFLSRLDLRVVGKQLHQRLRHGLGERRLCGRQGESDRGPNTNGAQDAQTITPV